MTRFGQQIGFNINFNQLMITPRSAVLDLVAGRMPGTEVAAVATGHLCTTAKL